MRSFTEVPLHTRDFLARARVHASGLACLIELIMPKFFLDGKLVLACALTDPVWEGDHCVEVLTMAFFVAFIILLQLIKGFLQRMIRTHLGGVSLDAWRLGSCLYCVSWLDEACIEVFKLLLSISGDILAKTS